MEGNVGGDVGGEGDDAGLGIEATDVGVIG